MAKSDYKVELVSVKVPEIVYRECMPDTPDTAERLVLAFLEMCEAGVKFSFSWKEAQRSFNVSVTLPAVGIEAKPQCATFWSDDLWEALATAYIVTYIYKAYKLGWDIAKEAMKNVEKHLQAEYDAYRSSKGR